MIVAEELADCPTCRSAGAVTGDRCAICDGRIEADPGADDLPPSAPPPPPLTFTQVLGELQAISKLVDEAQAAPELRAMVTRVEALLETLRTQFLEDITTFPTPARS